LVSGESVDFFDGDVGGIAGEVVVVGEEEHAVALLPLAHGYAGAVPVAVLCLGLLILVESTGAEGRAQGHLVLGEATDDHGGHALLGAVGRIAEFHVAV